MLMEEQYYKPSKILMEYEDQEPMDDLKSKSNDSAREFNCNICLDMVQDPVITLCGHLYCWSCIYKWIQTVSCNEPDKHCPVCNAHLSVNTLVPLYGPGRQSPGSAYDKDVPRRPSAPPPACGAHTVISATATTAGDTHDYGRELAGITTYDWIFSNSERGVYGHENTYGSARLRRHEVMLDKSLGRVSFFLSCCVVVCLLLF